MKLNSTQKSGAAALGLAALVTSAATVVPTPQGPFERVSTFYVFENSDVDSETVAEIVAATVDGMTLIYTDSEQEQLGFVDISDARNPQPAGTLDLGGEPTSVAVRGGHALVAIDTSDDFVNTSGDLLVVDIATQSVVQSLPLGGQPDSVAVSPDGQYAAIAIENAVSYTHLTLPTILLV